MFDETADHDRDRLLLAGWVEINYAGDQRWVAPDAGAYSFQVAVEILNGKQLLRRDGPQGPAQDAD